MHFVLVKQKSHDGFAENSPEPVARVYPRRRVLAYVEQPVCWKKVVFSVRVMNMENQSVVCKAASFSFTLFEKQILICKAIELLENVFVQTSMEEVK